MRTILDGGKPIKSDIVTATWAGWVDEPSGSVQAAEGDFWVPCIHPSTIWETASSWVGIGGIYGGNVVQAGTHEEHHSWPGGIEQYVYDAFIENAPNYGETQVFSVNCNDKMYVDVWDPNNMFIEDLSSGVYWSGTQGGAFGDNSMEWITEKDSSHNLADFNSDTFTDCWGEEYYNNFELIQSLNPVKFVAKRNGQQNGPQLMGVGSLVGDFNSGSQFTNTWIQGS